MQLGEIVVTAQKREQRLSEVPVTVNAAGAPQLQALGIVTVGELGKVAPSFSAQSNIYGYPTFSIRGVGYNGLYLSSPPAVSTYLDEAPIPYSAMTSALLFDVDRVEVLKGPQGTLFGQNATGGSINVISAKPQRTPGAAIHIDANQFGGVTAEGYVTGSLADTVNARFALQTVQGGGWQKGYYLNHRKNGDANRLAGRFMLDWRPGDRFKALLSVNASYDKGEVIQPQLALMTPVNPSALIPAQLDYPAGRRNRDADIDPGFNTHADNRMLQIILRTDYEINDQLTVTGVSDFIDFNLHSPVNFDGIAFHNSRATMFGNVRHYSQEVRLSGTGFDGRMHFVIGGSFSKDRARDGQTSDYGPAGEGYSALPPNEAFTGDYIAKVRSAAAFFNADYKLVPDLTVTIGARYTATKESIHGCIFGNANFNGLLSFLSGAFRSIAGLGPVPGGDFAPNTCATINDVLPNVESPTGAGLIPDYLPLATVESQNEHNISWRGAVDYRIADGDFLYASVSRGYKAGTFPAVAGLLSSNLTPVKQERVDAYEVGTKLTLLGRRLNLNVSIFYNDYANKQVNSYVEVPVLGITAQQLNIPKSQIFGFDTDVLFRPMRELTLRAAATYLKSRANSFVAINGLGQTVNASHKPLPYSPVWSGNFDAEYEKSLTDNLYGYFGFGGQFASHSFSDLAKEPLSRNPGYWTFDARLGVRSTSKWAGGGYLSEI